ncbi:hypothetical protein Agub_g13355 [Astrephomene gubernaculifera]|uniref:Uncharacterized protein n=1 Tax=Astrephomene gubernaculifera TaxID=47775 RepID=A0AAD3E042_9CHLO|nr:hypothetical protein Agub_g13355 [Astrephomene gubernaculifera]
MAPTKELKPPPELVDAIQKSEDMTAPSNFTVGTEFGSDVPRTIRNRLVHEEPQKLSHDDKGEGHGQGDLSKRELKEHMMEVQEMQAGHDRFNRNHPGAGKAGQGDYGTVNSQACTRGEGGGRMRYGHD